MFGGEFYSKPGQDAIWLRPFELLRSITSNDDANDFLAELKVRNIASHGVALGYDAVVLSMRQNHPRNVFKFLM